MGDATKWVKLRGHAGLEFRDYGEEGKTWRFRQMSSGKTFQDYFGAMEEEEAVLAVATLKRNRKTGAGPQTYKEMESESLEVDRLKKIEEEKARKQAIVEDDFLHTNTIENFWKNIYWPKRQKKGSAHGNKSMEGVFRLWVQPSVGSISLTELTFLDVQNMLDRMQEAGRSEKTQLHAYSCLQSVWNWARKYHSVISKIELSIFPGVLIEKEDLNNEKTCWLESGEAKKLLFALKNWRECCRKNGIYCKGPDSENAYGMTVLSLFSGLRFGDIAKLTWGEIADKEMAYARNPKGGKSYGIHLDVPLIRKMLAERRSSLETKSRPDDLVFKNIRGKMYTTVPEIYDDVVYDLQLNYVPRRWNNKKERIDFHALRHTFGSWMAMRGENLYTIMELMGHKSLKMTQRYARLDPTKTKKAVVDMYRDFEELDI